MRLSKYVEITPDFECALSKNFCAKKYFYGLPEYKQMYIAQKAKKLSKAELKDYVTELGNIIT